MGFSHNPHNPKEIQLVHISYDVLSIDLDATLFSVNAVVSRVYP
jgi:hypothetical protein